jgi:HEAT repeat protein
LSRFSIVLSVFALACLGRPFPAQVLQLAQKEASSMSSTSTLQELLAKGNWDAVAEGRRLGVEALPVVQAYAKDKNSVSRQIALACAGQIGGAEAASLLAAGLSDRDINVQLTAAKELGQGKFPAASPAILENLANGKDELVREFLALDAGYIPGDKTLTILEPLAGGKGALATNAKMAMARLGDARARAMLASDLSSDVPRTRYEALDQLRYVEAQEFVPRAKVLLADLAPARRIGTARNPRFRRVCDQAVDTLAFLLRLNPSFGVAPEKIYSPEQLAQFRQLLP